MRPSPRSVQPWPISWRSRFNPPRTKPPAGSRPWTKPRPNPPAAARRSTSPNTSTNCSKDFKKLKAKAQELQAAKDDLEFQLELRKEELPKQLDALRQELTRQIAARDAEIAQWKQQYETTQAAAPSGAPSAPASPELAAQIQTLERQRAELEGRLAELEQKYAALQAEKTTWTKAAVPLLRDPQNPQAPQPQWHRQRLLRQARALRGFRRQINDTQSALENGRAEIAQQRDQVRARKENLEQVKRLLEKQEMVMARKLADHNAIKTVAAVGIFVIMVLGSVFFGVYRFVPPLYRSEAVVQLAAPPDLQGVELQAWLNQQKAFMWSGEVTAAAWKILRNGEDHYAMHDVREEWLGSLGSHLSLSLDPASNTLAVRYTGPDAEGLSQVCNALAMAYTTPGKRDSAKANETLGLGSQVLAQATAPAYPVEDSRLMISLSVVAVTLLVSLMLVMIFRHFIARQLREIDQMADAQELEDIKGDLPEGAEPAAN